LWSCRRSIKGGSGPQEREKEMFYKVASVEPLPGFILRVGFQNGKTRYYDVAPLFEKWEAFRDLRDVPGLFALVRVDQGGYGISWNDTLDLECNDLWEFGTESAPEIDKAV